MCANNWVTRIAGVKRVDRWMDDLTEEPSVQRCLMGRLVKSQMKWTRHVERMNEDRLSSMESVQGRGGEEDCS